VLDSLPAAWIGEFFGTATLILLGDGVVAAVLLEKSKAKNAGWIVITAGWAFAVTMGIFVSKALGGPGALNPVGPFVDLVLKQAPLSETLGLIGSQVLGAMLGATLVWLQYFPHWGATKDQDLKLGVFCTAPAIRSPLANFFSEFLGTLMLVFLASAVVKAAAGPLEPSLVGLVVWAIGLSLGATTGYAINPARDFGPRLMHALLPIAGKGGSDWGYAWIPIAGPFAGAVVGAWLFELLATAAPTV
jgi:glycerol uptake facilitator protein